MDTLKAQIQRLLKEADKFNYENFSTKSQYGFPERYSPEWLSWSNRVFVILDSSFKDNSSPIKLINYCKQIQVFGCYEDKFLQLKSFLVNALKSSISILEDDLYHEIKYDEVIQPDALELVKMIISRFHLVARQLKIRHSNRVALEINDEYDTQDLLHALLKLFFKDIRPEVAVPNFAEKNSRLDFFIVDAGIGIEVKKTRESMDAKELGKQLIDDIARYKMLPNLKTLVFFVYDPDEWINNPVGLENDLCQKNDTLNIEVFVVPKIY